MTKVDLTEAQRLTEAASEGPWHWDEHFEKDVPDGDGLALTNPAGAEVVGAYNYHCCAYRIDPHVEAADMAFIAAARSLVPGLIGELTEARQQLETAQQRAERLKMERDNLVKINAGLAAQLDAAIAMAKDQIKGASEDVVELGRQAMLRMQEQIHEQVVQPLFAERDEAEATIERVRALCDKAIAGTVIQPDGWALDPHAIRAALGAAVNGSSTEATQ